LRHLDKEKEGRRPVGNRKTKPPGKNGKRGNPKRRKHLGCRNGGKKKHSKSSKEADKHQLKRSGMETIYSDVGELHLIEQEGRRGPGSLGPG